MESLLEDWPWATFNQAAPASTASDCLSHPQFSLNDAALPSDILHDLSLPSSSALPSKPYDVDQTLPSFDEDMFSCLDDFILYPDQQSEELRLFESQPRHQSRAIETDSYLSPVSSMTESYPSPTISQISSVEAHTPEQQRNDSDSVDKELHRRRRRNSTVYPCTLCDRVCHTSVEARRHHARHVKPFKCPEPQMVPLQTIHHTYSSHSSHQTPSHQSGRPRCEKAFATKNELERHRKSVHYCIPEVGPKEWFKCPIEGCKIAERLWPRRDNLLVHMKQAHPERVGTELSVYIPHKESVA